MDTLAGLRNSTRAPAFCISIQPLYSQLQGPPKLHDRSKTREKKGKKIRDPCGETKQLIWPVFHSTKWRNNGVSPYVRLNKQSDERVMKHGAAERLVRAAVMKRVPICLSPARPSRPARTCVRREERSCSARSRRRNVRPARVRRRQRWRWRRNLALFFFWQRS